MFKRLASVIVFANIMSFVMAETRSSSLLRGNSGPSESETPNELRRLGVPGGRPIIYTFYDQIEGVTGKAKGTGMSDQADKELLAAWQQTWYESGWQPIVLSIGHAKLHPEFIILSAQLEGLPFRRHNRLCFLRWLAMAAVGGGWMTDYDTFPLHSFGPALPNDGRFTVHEGSKDGGVPSLASGNAEEWSRMARSLLVNAPKHGNEELWNDMSAMQDLYGLSNGDFYIMLRNVVPGLVVLHGRGVDEATCKSAEGKYAVHFSHYSVDKGVTENPNAAPEDRPMIAVDWIREFRDKCIEAFPEPFPQLPSSLAGDNKPIIYTFFSPDPGNPQSAGMTTEANQHVLDTWGKAWSENGWQPVVLTIENAKQHPDFESLNAMLDGLPFNYFDRLCFLRWLAMATVGGGWLVDYDVFPLHLFDNRELPNNGRLTVHEFSKFGGVPSMVSGNAEEWFRLAKAKAENAKAHEYESHWSDMKAIDDLYAASNGSFYVLEKNVVPGFVVLHGRGVDKKTCRQTESAYAVHFSTFSLNIGVTEKRDAGPQDRANIASNWLAEWRQNCHWRETNFS